MNLLHEKAFGVGILAPKHALHDRWYGMDLTR